MVNSMAFEENPQEPFMTFGKRIVFSIIGGLLITLATSVQLNTALLGTSSYGYPFAWLSQPLYPVDSPITLLWGGLFQDIMVWTIVAFLILALYQALRQR